MANKRGNQRNSNAALDRHFSWVSCLFRRYRLQPNELAGRPNRTGGTATAHLAGMHL